VDGYARPGLGGPLSHSWRVGSKLIAGHYDALLLNHTRHAQASLARLPEHTVAIPILHNEVGHIYDVGCGNPAAWNVAVAVSPKVAANARLRVPHRPVVQISSGVDLPSESSWRARKTMGQRVELIFIGRLEHAQKGVLWLPDIYQACLARGIDAGLTIVGDGPDAHAVQAKLSVCGLLERTRLLNGLSPETVYELLLQSHMLLMPSLYEGLPIALLESQACGCVPIASRLPGITDTSVDDGLTGVLVEVGDVSGYADAVAALAGDPVRWSAMSRAAHAKIRQSFSVECMGTAYLQLIKDTIQGRYPLPRARKYQAPIDIRLFPWREFLPNRLRRLGRRGRTWLAGLSTRPG
jgi:glycosyltransferase involved in cell wall biosynthesis